MNQTTPALNCIDGHAHLAPLSFLQEVHRSGATFGVEVEDTAQGFALTFPGLPRLRPAGGRVSDLDGRTTWMDAEGIESQVTGAWLDVQGYSLPADSEREWVRLLNEHLASTVREAGPRFTGMASVPLKDGEAAALELEHAVKDLGLSGVMVASDPVDVDVARTDFESFWEAAEALDVPVMLHGATHSKWRQYGTPSLGYSLGRTLDTTVLVGKLLLGGLLDRHPRLRLVLCHGGGALPYLIGRLQDGYQRGTDKIVDLQRGGPADYLPDLYYDTVTLNTRSARLLLDVVGADHVMLGSDYVWGPMASDFSNAASDACASAEELAALRKGTATSLFGGAVAP